MTDRFVDLMLRGSTSLMLGSLLLLAGGLLPVARPTFSVLPFFYPMTVLALAFHLHGWVRLGQGAWKRHGEEPGEDRVWTRGMKWAFIGSLAGFAIGVFTLPVVVSGEPGWLWILVLFLFPYLPSVFVPVVGAHVAFFSMAIMTLRDRRAPAWMSFGVVSLIFVAGAATFSQFSESGGVGSFGLLFAGLTAWGYLLVAVGWRLERARINGTDQEKHLANTHPSVMGP